ncbi:SMP-30/gluconolactonase/LRE family protein [Variovorax saccharolyticus]|uniref:SMP-30/gluconolactonase/LRE family protein n=1 Tax=Variovorax saccharolyticus TaxID=3053516 RepID=UPI002574A560|nr:SMP-30/gluconolactonase/LRE family protein [Variovorax sp. J22R187]MDM0022215.1 SMP-30/gluconolactonase/LRE family protein [Variovorax sp. J22R187]
MTDRNFSADETSTLSYTSATRGLVPIPACERGLPTATATQYFQVSDQPMSLEGPAFDRAGNLLFVDPFGGRVMRLSMDKGITTLYQEDELHPTGIAVHKDGRIFVAALGKPNSGGLFEAGSVISIAPDGGDRQTIVPPKAGYAVDDLVFDELGGFYFTDFRGSSTEPTGGVYYVAPDSSSCVPVLRNMCAANGVALSPDGTVLWATEFANCRLHRVDLSAPAKPARFGALIPYHFIGIAPDSMRTDSAGNVYVAMYRQARILVFSPYGIPIGQILLPGREDNHFLKVTSLAIVPGSRDLLIVARDELGGRGAMVFAARGLAPGFPMFSHR